MNRYVFLSLYSIFVVAYLIFIFVPIAEAQDTSGMRGHIDYLIEETEATIDSLETAGEIEEVISCYRTILNVLRVARGQLDSVDALREYGPPE